MADAIHRLALRIAEAVGSPPVVLSVAVLVVVALIVGIALGWPDDFRWAISLTGTAVTLLMIFVGKAARTVTTRRSNSSWTSYFAVWKGHVLASCTSKT